MNPKPKATACILAIILLTTMAAAANEITAVRKNCPNLLEEGATSNQVIAYDFDAAGSSLLLENIQVQYSYDGGSIWSTPVSLGPMVACIDGMTCAAAFPVTLPMGSAGQTVRFRVTGAVYSASLLVTASVSGTSGPYTIVPAGSGGGGGGGAPVCIVNSKCDSSNIPPETCANCPSDCKCPTDCPCNTCGANGCEVGETPITCPADCPRSLTVGLRPITISSVETCPDGPVAGTLQKSTEYDARIRFTTTTPLEELRVYYCLTATAASPLPVGSGACKSGTAICLYDNQVACPAGECNPENCSVAGSCTCEARIKIPWAVPTAGIVISGTGLGVGQNTVAPEDYEVIAPVEVPLIAGSPEKQLLVYGGYQSFRCESVGAGRFPGCAYDFSCNGAVTDTNPVVKCRDCTDCKVKCAQACGESSTCMATASLTCDSCCDSSTCGKGSYIEYDFWKCLIVPCYALDQESCACKQACRGECEANTSFCNAVNLLRIIAGIAAAIMLVVQALRYVMSDDPMDRQNAKEGMWYVIIGALIIAIASGVVGYFFMEGLLC